MWDGNCNGRRSAAGGLPLARLLASFVHQIPPPPRELTGFFSLDRSTQKKCWYVRSSETQPQHARTQTNSAPVPAPSTSAEQADSTVTGGIDGPSGQLESSARVIHDPASDAVPNRSAPETVAQHNVQSPTLRENASIDANGQENATTSVALPDPPPMPPSVTTRATNMASCPHESSFRHHGQRSREW